MPRPSPLAFAAHEASLHQAEEARRQALLRGDLVALEALLAPELVHVHATGKVDSRASYMDAMRAGLRYTAIERHDMDVQLYDDCAVMTGQLSTSGLPARAETPITVRARLLQVWRMGADGWRMVAFQATRAEG